MFGARYGSFALVMGMIFASGSVLAQTETPGTWTDPPVRGAATPSVPEAAKAADSASAPETAAPDTGKPMESAGSPEKAAPARAAKTKAVAEARPVRRSATVRRAQIRRVAARAPTVAETHRHRAVAEGPRVRAERHGDASRVVRSAPPRYKYYAWRRNNPAYDEPDASPYRSRRAGWGGLIGDEGSRQIAQARSAGYLVMRSRTYDYLDGTRIRMLSPYDPGGPEE